MSRPDGSRCGLHYRRSDTCTCDYHCTGCRHVYGRLEGDCCTCCRSLQAGANRENDEVRP